MDEMMRRRKRIILLESANNHNHFKMPDSISNSIVSNDSKITGNTSILPTSSTSTSISPLKDASTSQNVSLVEPTKDKDAPVPLSMPSILVNPRLRHLQSNTIGGSRAMGTTSKKEKEMGKRRKRRYDNG